MRILLAEDESTISRLIKTVLASSGHEVVGVRTIGEAHTALDEGPFDLVLLDRNLADGDGTRLIEHIQRHAEKPPVVLMTGDRAFAHEEDVATRVQGMLWKPFELDELERLVKRFSA